MEKPTREWSVPDLDLKIVVSETALESLRRAAVVGLQKIPRRGLEIGGVLFGRREGNRVEIHQWREIECEHAYGPGFRLSEKDEKALAALLETAKEDPTLGQFEAVGLFRTRTRGEATVSDEDAALFDRHFPEPWQVLFVVRPYMYEPARAGFFVRDRQGRLITGVPAAELRLEVRRRRLPLDFDPSERPKPKTPETAQAPPRPAPASPPGPGAGPGPPPVPGTIAPPPAVPQAYEPPGGRSVPVPEPRPYPGTAGAGRRRSGRRTAAIAVGAALAALALILIAPVLSEQPATAGMELDVRELGDQLIVEWNPEAEAIQKAESAALLITDGGDRRLIELSPAELRGGSITYQGTGAEAVFALRVRTADGGTVTETARFAGGAGARPAATEPERRPETADLEVEIERVKAELEQEQARAERLRRAIAAKQRELAATGR